MLKIVLERLGDLCWTMLKVGAVILLYRWAGSYDILPSSSNDDDILLLIILVVVLTQTKSNK